ncbi:MAG: hypothetical protein IJU14_04815 [Clostridia bacterium]|nr:hypothetical protein [Clostridia bacterium]
MDFYGRIRCMKHHGFILCTPLFFHVIEKMAFCGNAFHFYGNFFHRIGCEKFPIKDKNEIAVRKH